MSSNRRNSGRRYLEPEYRTLGKHALWREEGKHGSYLKVNGKVFRDTSNSNIPRHAIWRPRNDLGQSRRTGSAHPSSDDGGRVRSAGAACATWMRWASIRRCSIRPGSPRDSIWCEDPDVAYALARAYNDWIADFCKAAPERLFAAAMVPLQNMDYHGRGAAAGREDPLLPRRVSSGRCSSKATTSRIRIYDPLWAELEGLGITAAVHATAGLWNPEWTSHGPFFEKIKSRFNQRSIIAEAGGGPYRRWRRRPRVRLRRVAAARSSDLRRFCPTGSTTTCSSPRP